jgi:photosystem II stability/assembly factor-like uncharacterized protein
MKPSTFGWTAPGLAALALFAAGAAAPARAAETPYAWTPVPYGAGGFVDGFLYHPKTAGLLYARTDIGGMYRYDFASKSWVALLDHLGRDEGELMGVVSMAIDPNDPKKLYAATGEYLGEWAHSGAVLASSDQGATWRKTDLPIKLGGNADGRGAGDRLQVDPNTGDILFLASNQDGLWRSADGGKTFAKITSPAAHLGLVLFDPASGAPGKPSQTVYVGASDAKGGLFVSHDAGVTFAPVAGAPKQAPQHAVFAPDGTLYVTFSTGEGQWTINPGNATDGGVWRQDAKTGRWTNISPERPGGFGYSGIDLDPSHPGHLVVSTLDRWGAGDEIYESKDGGGRWTALGPQSRHDASPYPWLVAYMGGQDKMGHWISDVRLNPFNPDELIYGTGYGLWMSRNLTAAGSGKPVLFDFNVKNFEETATLQMTSPLGGATLLVAFGDVGGAAWDDVSKTPKAGLFTPTNETDTSVDYAGQVTDVVVRTANNAPTHGYISKDSGVTWTPFASAPPYKPKDEKGQWHGPGVIAISAKASALVWAPEKDAAYVSTDRGASWTAVKGWPADRDSALTPISDKVADAVFYVYDKSTSSILISVDGGKSFAPTVVGIPAIAGWQWAQLAVVPGILRDLWLAGPFGLLHSPAAGKPMSNVKGVDEAWQVGFGKPAPGKAYPAVFLWGKVKGKEGIWRSDDEGATWLRVNDDRHQFGALRAIAGDPLEFGTVYIAPHGRGILVGKPGA